MINLRESMKNNKGFSLLELLIVIAIGAVLIGGAAFSLNLLNYGDVTKCARNLNESIRNLKVESVSRSTEYCYLILRFDATEETYYMVTAVSDEELDEFNWEEKAQILSYPQKLASGKVNISYTNRSDGTGLVDLKEKSPLIISYKAESGAYASEWKQITLESKGIISSIHMVTKTGNHYIK
ncbi:pilus assembly FimT family protein [Anaerocolumna sp. MB42-C2]|uniref:pilus assembly FimT family protein n=1 Tax=Anaerocolumna sp. MB42-C2 TaxID=3070997 RepID=UPI0027E04B8B|nr:prepilin-type N-terminal cleavage/methylation domain-containing protein [Anaerocolumna sp. MB42-C2]WMJ88588.1 prepilin-type N-terminal cleavage/methylation domain-containing protein [Anaerocolumna sp. MB42-C2]